MTFDATPLLRLHGRRRRAALAALDPVAAQERTLRGLLARARSTRFGKAHGFERIDGVRSYQSSVPVRAYEDFWRDWWSADFPRLSDATWPGRMPFFAQSSGTTAGTTKYIPVSHEMVRANRRAALDLLVHHLAARPGSRVLGGASFILGGSTDLVRRAPGVRSGDLSGIAAATVPFWARRWTFPPPELALVADWDEKVRRLVPAALASDIRSLSGTPSWLLLLIERLLAARPGATRLVEIFPRLELVIHGGVAFAPYRSRFAALLEGSRAESREVYAASEGFVALADRGPGEGLRLLPDNGIFLEFETVSDAAAEPHWLATVETGVNYAVVLTTNAGLWRYRLGDTVTFVERDPPRLLVTGRTAQMLSAFGEHLLASEIEAAAATAAASIGSAVVDLSAAAVMEGSLGRHVLLVELVPAVDPARLARFATALDAGLAAANLDYAEHRHGDLQLQPPLVIAVPPGGFTGWMRSRGKLGGQNKVPRVIDDPALFQSLRSFVDALGGPRS